jgi:hypothetical protein
MVTLTVAISTPANLYFKGTAGQTTFGDLLIVKDGVLVVSPTVTLVELVAGVYRLSYTPLSTGVYMIYVAGAIAGYIESVSRTMYSYLRNIEDESLGSWSWDKTTGVLNLIRRDGTPLGSFNVVDTQTLSSKELI